ncbi:hypothetical protein COY07_02180 [Candidatus Peregrinibacteria bacterium CG_4_10_14_0_2_um_filter_43_11]|nr:MAG: hypothetical protein COY07_02180 [Candidatus Peregrinibacteria bacterium CG_4_10_14_0_2_um_filter_43_11]
MTDSKNTIVGNIQKYFLLIILLVLIVALFFFLQPLFIDLLFAGIIVTAIYPLHRLLNQKVRIPKSASALITLILILLLIVTPFTLFFFFIAHEATGAYVVIMSHVNRITSNDIRLLPELIYNSFIGQAIDQLKAYTPISTADIVSAIGEIVRKISTLLISETTTILKQIPIVLVHMIIFLLTVFYFIRDGERLVAHIRSLLPLSQKYRKEVFHKLHQLSYAILYGIFGAAILQGVLVGVGFSFAGISNAAFWGSVAALFSPLPYIGVSIVWIPAVIVLMSTGHGVAGLFLLIWCVAIVSFADNIIKPYLIGSSTRIHPLAVLLVLIGGVFAFGIKGLFFGPFLLTLGLAFLHIYELEYKSVLGGGK